MEDYNVKNPQNTSHLETQPQTEKVQQSAVKTSKKRLIILLIVFFIVSLLILGVVVYHDYKNKYASRLKTPTPKLQTGILPSITPCCAENWSTDYAKNLLENYKKNQESKKCIVQEKKLNTEQLIAFIKSPRQKEGEIPPKTSVWISDKNGCNHQQISTASNVCKIFGFSPDNTNLLVAQCLDNTERSGFMYESLSLINIADKQTKLLTKLPLNISTLYAFWVNENAIWYAYDDSDLRYSPRIAEIRNRDNSTSQSTIDKEIASYCERIGKAFVYSININGNKQPIVYPNNIVGLSDSDYAFVPEMHRIYTSGTRGIRDLIKLYDISTQYPVYLDGKDIGFRNKYLDYGYEFFVYINNKKLMFRDGGELFTTDLDGNNKSSIIQTNKDTVILDRLSGFSDRALYPVTDCVVPNTPLSNNRQVVFYNKKTGKVKTYQSQNTIFAYDLNMNLDLDNKTLRDELCQDWYILDTSETEVSLVGPLCNEDEWCNMAVIN